MSSASVNNNYNYNISSVGSVGANAASTALNAFNVVDENVSLASKRPKENLLHDLFWDPICGSLTEIVEYWSQFGFFDKNKNATYTIVPDLLAIIKRHTKLVPNRTGYEEGFEYDEHE